MQEPIVSFETAKLLKEAGFDWKVNYWHDEISGIVTGVSALFAQSVGSPLIPAPTLSHAAMWLRVVHGVHVYADLDYDGRDWHVVIRYKDGVVCSIHELWETHDAAYEHGIQHELRRIINRKNEHHA